MRATPLVGDLFVPPEQLSPEYRRSFLEVISRGETSLHVGRPTPEVYAYCADFTHLPEWLHTCWSIESAGFGPITVGWQTRAWETQDLQWDQPPMKGSPHAGMPYETLLTITGVEPEERIKWEARTDPELFSGQWQLRFEPVNERITMVRLSVELTADESCRLALIAALQRWAYPLDVIQRQIDRSMHNLRAILEGRAAPPLSGPVTTAQRV